MLWLNCREILEYRFFFFHAIHGIETNWCAHQRVELVSFARVGVLCRFEIQHGQGFITYADPPWFISFRRRCFSLLATYEATSRWCQVCTDKDDAEAERSNRPSGQKDERKERTKERTRGRTDVLSLDRITRDIACERISASLLHTSSCSPSLSSSLIRPCSLIPLASFLYSSDGLPPALWHGKLRSRR